MAKYVTIIDIARELGISKSTVSRALSGDTGNVKAETLQRILETAERMGYHRNELAVNFRQQSTHNIGIIIPEIVTTFYMTFINDAQAILRKQGYKVIERGIPIVFFDRTVEGVKASLVHMDDYIMSFFMVEALLRKGYKHIIHIPGPAYIRNSYERLSGYRDALEKFHVEYQPQDVLSPALSAEEGSWVMKQYLQQNVPFDAVFGFTETAVLGAKSEIQKQGLRIPNDVALCCMSGTALATLVHPQLTAVEQPIGKMAQESCRLLMEHITDSNKKTEEIALRGETVIREST